MGRHLKEGGRRRNPAVAVALFAAFSYSFAHAAAGSAPAVPLPLKVLADIPLPGTASRFDYESDDAARHRLFIAHLGDDEVLAFDTQAQRVVGRISGLSRVHGVLTIPELDRVYASATGTDEVVAIDAQRLTVMARIPGGHYPDGMAYAPPVHQLFVSDEVGRTETVIDVRSNRRVATIPLGGEVGNSQYDPVSRHVFVNVQTRAQLVEIDPDGERIVRRIDLPGAEGNHGLLIEPRRRLAFIACEDDDELLVFDLQSHRVKQSFHVGHQPDVLAYDAGLGLLYVASESGIVALFRLERDRLDEVGEGELAPNAHVVAVDPSTHRSYFPVKNLDGRPALRIAVYAP